MGSRQPRPGWVLGRCRCVCSVCSVRASVCQAVPGWVSAPSQRELRSNPAPAGQRSVSAGEAPPAANQFPRHWRNWRDTGASLGFESLCAKGGTRDGARRGRAGSGSAAAPGRETGPGGAPQPRGLPGLQAGEVGDKSAKGKGPPVSRVPSPG